MNIKSSCTILTLLKLDKISLPTCLSDEGALTLADWFPVADRLLLALICSVLVGFNLSGMTVLKTPIIVVVRTIHNKTWVRQTKAMPKIFPIINSNGFTDEIMTSTILLVFSSMTPFIT